MNKEKSAEGMISSFPLSVKRQRSMKFFFAEGQASVAETFLCASALFSQRNGGGAPQQLLRAVAFHSASRYNRDGKGETAYEA